jgi:hypothetical protein
LFFKSYNGTRLPDPAKPDLWINAFVLRFETKGERYRWLNTVLATAHGTFDMKAGRSRFLVYVPRRAASKT